MLMCFRLSECHLNMNNWTKTKLALSDLDRLLTCSICKRLVQDPCSLEACDHHFCRNCVEKVVGVESKCPECGVFAWSKDLKVNRRLADIVALFKSIRNIVGYNEDTEVLAGEDICNENIILEENSENTENTENLREGEKDTDVESHTLNKEDISSLNELNTLGQRKELVDNKGTCVGEREVYHLKDYISQESETEEMNSSIELFSTNGSYCCENDAYLGTPSLHLNNSCSEEPYIALHTDDKDTWLVSSDKTNSKSETPKTSGMRTKCNTNSMELNIHWNDMQAKRKKRKISECELEIEKRGIISTMEEKSVLLLRKKTPENKKCNSVQKYTLDGEDVDNNSSSVKKRSRLSLSHKSVNNSTSTKTNASTPQSKARKQILNSPTSLHSLELSPAQLMKRNKRGESLLHVAAIKGNVEDARYLLGKGADPNGRDNAGWSPLHEACNHGHLSIAELLLDNGALVDLTGGPEHETPLHDAVANGRLEVVKLLVKRGASLNARNNQGLTPSDYASTDSIKVLLKPSLISMAHYQALTADKENIFKTHLTKNQKAAKVLLPSGLSTEQKEKLELCSIILGGKVVQEFSADVTHIVTTTSNSGFCRRTMKYLCGILCGKWIVSFGWITKCLTANTWAEETTYEVKGTSNAKTGIPCHARLNHLQQLPSLFDGCQFYLSGTFDPKTPCKEELTKLVKYGGGKILTREPKQEVDYSSFILSKDYDNVKKTSPKSKLPTVAYHAQPDSTQYRCTIYIIYDPTSQNKQPLRNVSGPSIAPVGWLLDCISNFEIMDIETFLFR